MTQDLPNISTITQQDKEKATSPPYISFVTFSNLITWLETEGVPIKFDRSFWGKKFGGGLGLQLMAGMRFLGLLKDDYTQQQLGEIVKARGDERKKLLVDMLQKAYSAVDFSQLAGGTPSMLKDWFAKYNLDGSTDRKARSFFINACKAYGIPLSNVLKKAARNKQTGGTINREKKLEKEKTNPLEVPKVAGNQNPPVLSQTIQRQETGQQDLYRVTLSNGCEIKLSSNVEFFEIEKTDRVLIEDIVEVMKKCRKK
jgi:hypothetical protein